MARRPLLRFRAAWYDDEDEPRTECSRYNCHNDTTHLYTGARPVAARGLCNSCYDEEFPLPPEEDEGHHQAAHGADLDYPELAEVLAERPPPESLYHHGAVTADEPELAQSSDAVDMPGLPEPGAPPPMCSLCGIRPAEMVVGGGTTACRYCAQNKFGIPLDDDEPAQFGQYTSSLIDPEIRFEFTASWADVRSKAARIRREGGVRITGSPGPRHPYITADVKGDHAVYQTVLMRTLGGKSVAAWECGCPWADYAWGRTGRWKRYEGRMCSHALATVFQAQADEMFGGQVKEIEHNPAWLSGNPPKHSALVVESAEEHPWVTKAKDFFGTTKNMHSTGYIFPDGTMPDLSFGGDEEGERAIAHAAMANKVGAKGDTYTAPENFNRKTKSLRVVHIKSYDKHGIHLDLQHPITPAQTRTIMAAHKEAYDEGYPVEMAISGPATPEGKFGHWENKLCNHPSDAAGMIQRANASFAQKPVTALRYVISPPEEPPVVVEACIRLERGETPTAILRYLEALQVDDPPGLLALALQAKNKLAAAGLWVKAADTGRVLMLQRSAKDHSDPAAGTWEAPGGHIEEGEHAVDAARREWSEETGAKLPEGHFAGEWLSPNGVHQSFIYVVPHEDDVDINTDPTNGRALNPDDPDGDDIEVAAWFDPKDLPDMPSLRSECHDSDWGMIKKADRRPRAVNMGPSIAPHYDPEGVHNPGATEMDRLEPEVADKIRSHVEKNSPDPSEPLTHEQVVNNLITIHRHAQKHDPQALEQGMSWYHRAHQHVKDTAKMSGIHARRVAGMYAAMSPRADWDENRESAHYTAMQLSDPENRLRLAPEHAKKYGVTPGKKFSEMDHQEAADSIYAQGRHTDDLRVMGVPPAKSTGKQPSVRWSTGTKNLKKAVRIARGEDPDKVLGGHKVRSFFNNLTDPANKHRSNSVTMDSHAVSAAAMHKYTSSDAGAKTVANMDKMFETGGSPTKHNVHGTYAHFADAYREAHRRLVASGEMSADSHAHDFQAQVWTHWRNHTSRKGNVGDDWRAHFAAMIHWGGRHPAEDDEPLSEPLDPWGGPDEPDPDRQAEEYERTPDVPPSQSHQGMLNWHTAGEEGASEGSGSGWTDWSDDARSDLERQADQADDDFHFNYDKEPVGLPHQDIPTYMSFQPTGSLFTWAVHSDEELGLWEPPVQAELRDHPEPALPSTDGGAPSEAWELSHGRDAPNPGQTGPAGFGRPLDPNFEHEDMGDPERDQILQPGAMDTGSLVRATEDEMAGTDYTASKHERSWLLEGAQSPPGGSQGPGDYDIAAMARLVLAEGSEVLEKVAAKVFTPSEQAELINEGDGQVRAANLDRLDLAKTHYADLEEELQMEEAVLW